MERMMAVESSLWFEEILEIDDGRTIKIKIDDIIEKYDSKIQRIEIYKTKPFGKMLVLDGVVMCTEWDEHAYHEMIAHVPMFVHPNPEDILIVGGGDGGALREVLRHHEVKRVDICEIDSDVIRLSRKHLPALACSFDDSRVTIYYQDGAEFVKDRKNQHNYDIVIVDSADPIGVSKVLFSEDFYSAIKDILKEDGIAVTQSESFYYNIDLIERLIGYAKKYYKVASYYFTTVPTYPSGVIGFTYCSKIYHPLNDFKEERTYSIQSSLKYYNPNIHRGSFQLPSFIKNRLYL